MKTSLLSPLESCLLLELLRAFHSSPSPPSPRSSARPTHELLHRTAPAAVPHGHELDAGPPTGGGEPPAGRRSCDRGTQTLLWNGVALWSPPAAGNSLRSLSAGREQNSRLLGRGNIAPGAECSRLSLAKGKFPRPSTVSFVLCSTEKWD